MNPRLIAILVFVVVTGSALAWWAVAGREPLRQRIRDEAPGERWIYDDWEQAREQARTSGKPMLVVFRCVP